MSVKAKRLLIDMAEIDAVKRSSLSLCVLPAKSAICKAGLLEAIKEGHVLFSHLSLDSLVFKFLMKTALF